MLMLHTSRVDFGPACGYAASFSGRAVARSTSAALGGIERLLEYDAALHDAVFSAIDSAPLAAAARLSR
eukprot:6197125-Pleurochrysis_carterae.AAC.4